MIKTVRLATKNAVMRSLTIIFLTTLSIASALLLIPKMEYLPQGNRNLVISILVPPPGLSYEEMVETGYQIFDAVKPHFQKDFNGFPGV